MWKYRTFPYKTNEDAKQYEESLKKEIDTYLFKHPEIEYPLSFNLKELNIVVEGMNKEMVDLLYHKPNLVINESSQKFNSSEKWIYKSHSGETRIYFYNSRVVAIETKFFKPVFP